jgi:flagellar hook-associated protein 1 FlgK
MMNLRDVATFDGAAMTDGHAGLIAQIGIRNECQLFGRSFHQHCCQCEKTGLGRKP